MAQHATAADSVPSPQSGSVKVDSWMTESPFENPDQVALLKWISAGLQIDEVRNLRGDAGYLLNNMIAKYTLAGYKS
jgi:hypothetical protein